MRPRKVRRYKILPTRADGRKTNETEVAMIQSVAVRLRG
jgi:hypothetical protein